MEFNWKFQMETIFEFQDLMDIIDGTEVKPEDEEVAKIWLKSDRKVRMLIGHALESVQVRQVMYLKTANEMWKRLQSLYELKNSTLVHLYKNSLNIRWSQERVSLLMFQS